MVRHWLSRIGVQTLYIKPGSPWENGYIESFNGKLRDERFNGEIFYTLRKAQVLICQQTCKNDPLRTLKNDPPVIPKGGTLRCNTRYACSR